MMRNREKLTGMTLGSSVALIVLTGLFGCSAEPKDLMYGYDYVTMSPVPDYVATFEKVPLESNSATLKTDTVTVTVGENGYLSFEKEPFFILGEEVPYTVSFKSSDPTIVEVDAQGNWKAVGEGGCQVYPEFTYDYSGVDLTDRKLEPSPCLSDCWGESEDYHYKVLRFKVVEGTDE